MRKHRFLLADGYTRRYACDEGLHQSRALRSFPWSSIQLTTSTPVRGPSRRLAKATSETASRTTAAAFFARCWGSSSPSTYCSIAHEDMFGVLNMMVRLAGLNKNTEGKRTTQTSARKTPQKHLNESRLCTHRLETLGCPHCLFSLQYPPHFLSVCPQRRPSPTKTTVHTALQGW